MIREINTLLESLKLTAPPLERDPSCLEGDVEFVELFKKYESGDFREEEIDEEEDVVELKEEMPNHRRRKPFKPQMPCNIEGLHRSEITCKYYDSYELQLGHENTIRA
ncbi:hypothetical protein Tco_0836676 [Tanacetum coccineum]